MVIKSIVVNSKTDSYLIPVEYKFLHLYCCYESLFIIDLFLSASFGESCCINNSWRSSSSSYMDYGYDGFNGLKVYNVRFQRDLRPL